MPPAGSSRELTERSEACSETDTFARALHDYLAMAGGLLYWGIFGSLLTLFSLPLQLLPRGIGKKSGHFMLHQLFRFFVIYLRISDLVRPDLSALDRLAKTNGPFIVAPNHHALWDVVFLISKVPGLVCVMKKSILHNPMLGGGARLAGFIPNASHTSMIRSAIKSLQQGNRLLLFPEGTRTLPDALWINPLKGGTAIIAAKSEAPIYPVFIRSDSRFTEKGWPLWRRPSFPITLRMDLGEPVFPGENESAADFTKRLQSLFETELSKNHPLMRKNL